MLSLWLRCELPALEATKIRGRVPSLYRQCMGYYYRHNNGVNVIFRPHGRTVASALRYFLSTSSYCVFFSCFFVFCATILNFTALVSAMPAISNKILYFGYSTFDF